MNKKFKRFKGDSKSHTIDDKQNPREEVEIVESEVMEENTQTSDKVRHTYENFLYGRDFGGVPAVLVDTAKAESINNRKVRNGLYLFEKIRDIDNGGIVNITAIGVTLYKIIFDSIEKANSFVENPRLKERNIRAFIPRNFVETFGVVRDVPQYISDEDFMQNAISDVKISSVKRFTRKLSDGKLVPTQSVKVEVFYPLVRQCFKCGRLGHTRNGCKSQMRCLKCGKEGGCESDCGIIKCVLCGDAGHKASEKNKCAKWKKEISINKIMTLKKMSRREVLDSYNVRSNSFEILSDNENFPSLPRSNDNRNSNNNLVNRILTPFSYSKIVKSPPRTQNLKPHFEKPRRMFEETGPSRPVFEGYEKVSELEKLTTEILNFMRDHFKQVNNSIGLQAVGHFLDRVNKIGIGLDHQFIMGANDVVEFTRITYKLFLFLRTFREVLVVGDFNARNAVWGDTVTTSKGKSLADAADFYDFRNLNEGGCTFRSNVMTDHGSVLDLSFSRGSLDVKFCIMPIRIGGSHHFPICLETGGEPSRGRFLAKRSLLTSLSTVEFDADFDVIQNKFKEEIRAATFTISVTKTPKYWWNGNLEVLFRRKTAAWKKALKYPSSINCEEACKLDDLWEYEKRKAKRDSYQSKLELLNRSPNTKDAWAFVRNVAGTTKGKFHPWDDANDAKYLEFLRNQVPNSTCDRDVSSDLANCESVCEFFTFEEFQMCLFKKKVSSAAGLDGVSYDMIKALPDLAKRSILTSFNDIFISGDMPESWRVTKIVPIPKQGKDLNVISNFRPISLLSVFLKLLNMMIKQRLIIHLNDRNYLPSRCFAYRSNCSTTTCINELLHRIAVLKKNGFKIMLASVDISNAYNCVRTDILIRKLLDAEVDGSTCKWILTFLNNRTLKLGSEETRVGNGLPQGSCLSPILFNIYSKPLHSIEDDCTLVFQYADDFMIISFNRDFSAAEENLDNKVNEFWQLCSDLNLSFNPDKAFIMNMSRDTARTIKVIVNGSEVKQVRSIKFLGRLISSNNTVKEHYADSLAGIEKRINILKCLTTIRGGLSPSIALNFFRSLVRSKIEYARTTTVDSPKYVNNKIAVVINKCLRRCLGVTPSTPTHLLYIMANELPVDKSSFANDCNFKSGYSLTYQRFREVFDAVNTNIDFSCDKEIKIIYDSLPATKGNCSYETVHAIYNRLIGEYKDRGFSIFATDASLSETATGMGVYNYSLKQRFYFRLNFGTSSLFGELLAIRQALRIASEDLIERILEDSNIKNLEIVWVPSHCGIYMNEEADTIAKNAIDVGAPLKFELNTVEALRYIRRLLYSDWQNEYLEISENKGRHFASIYPTIKPTPWFNKVSLPARDIKLINRLLTGHTYDSVYLHRIGVLNTDQCEVCHTENSAQHMIFNCKKFDIIRLLLFLPILNL